MQAMRHWAQPAERWWREAQVFVRSSSATGCCSLPCVHERAVTGLRPATARLRSRMASGLARDCSDWLEAEKAPCSIERLADQIASRCRPVAKASSSRTKRRIVWPDLGLDLRRWLDPRWRQA